jgi:hypothetical protein
VRFCPLVGTASAIGAEAGWPSRGVTVPARRAYGHLTRHFLWRRHDIGAGDATGEASQSFAHVRICPSHTKKKWSRFPG